MYMLIHFILAPALVCPVYWLIQKFRLYPMIGMVPAVLLYRPRLRSTISFTARIYVSLVNNYISLIVIPIVKIAIVSIY
jgi:hypothetical protein